MIFPLWRSFVIGHVLDGIVGLAALVAILDYFGIKPKRPLWGIVMPLNKNWKLGMMLALVVASLAMSGYGFYRSLRPRIVTVEKPVEKIVEKLVPQICPKLECPTPTPSKQKTPSESPKVSGSTPAVSTSGTGSPAVGSVTQGAGSAFSINQQGGITAGTINYATPNRRLTDDQKASLESCLRANPGTFSVSALSGIAKLYKYAQDWAEVFSAAGWKNENAIPVMSFEVGAGDWSGLRIGLFGSWDDANKQALIKDGSPEMSAYQCISKATISGGGQFTIYPDMKTGRVQINVGDY